MKRKPWYAALAVAWGARERCTNTAGSEWYGRWDEYIAELVNMLPSGSGFDRDVTVESVTSRSIKLAGSYHVMNDVGYYVGWVGFDVTVTAELTGVDLTVSLCEYDTDAIDDESVTCGLDEYIGDVFFEVVSADVDPIGANC